MKATILAILVFSPFCIGAQQYPPQGEWQPDLLGWYFGNEMPSQPVQVTWRPAPDFDEADGTKFPSFFVQPFIYNKPVIFDTPLNYSPGQPAVPAHRSAVAVLVDDRPLLGA